jgi:hypothetical protein
MEIDQVQQNLQSPQSSLPPTLPNNQSHWNKLIYFGIFIFITITMFFVLIFFENNYQRQITNNRSLSIDTIDNSKQIDTQKITTDNTNTFFNLQNIIDTTIWSKSNYSDLWFPYKNGIVLKKANQMFEYMIPGSKILKLKKPINGNEVEKNITSLEEVNKTIKILEEQQMTVDKEMTGLFNNGSNRSYPYYSIVYNKNNEWCQLQFIFECYFESECGLNTVMLGCQNFDIAKTYEEQKNVYQLLPLDYKDIGHSQAILRYEINTLGYKRIFLNARSDGSTIILDKSNAVVCEAKACCYEDYKNSSDPMSAGFWNDNWCLGYQPVDIY